MSTPFTVLRQVARVLDALTEGIITTSADPIYTDSALAGLGYRADDFTDGTFFGIDVVHRITAFSGTAFTVTPGGESLADVPYGAMTRRYPLGQMVQKLNEFLTEIEYPFITDLAGVSGQLAYTLSSPQIGRTLRQVWIADGADPLTANWTPNVRWWIDQYTPRIMFDVEPGAGLTIRLIHAATPAAVTASSGTIPDSLDVGWVATETALRLARWRLSQPGDSRGELVEQVNDLAQRAAVLRARMAPIMPARHPRLPANLDAALPGGA